MVDAPKVIAAHTRRAARSDSAERGEELKFFDESKVPVQTLTLLHADLQGVPADQYEIIGEKVTYRIAQRPGAYRCDYLPSPGGQAQSHGSDLGLAGPAGCP